MPAFFGPPAFLWSCKMRSLPATFGLLAALVALSTAQIPFGPVFPVSQYFSDEGGQQLIHLSANILTGPGTPSFNGSIEVDITADDPSSKNAAEFMSDYVVNLPNASRRTFTVVFQSNQVNSTEHTIYISDDSILEGDETFRLRIVAARFIGQAADIFRAQDGLYNTFADVIIKDDDFVSVSWTIAQPVEVTEGYEVEVRLRAQAFGLYENPIEIGVVCAAATSTSVEPALPGRDYSFAVGTKLNFTDVETFSSFSFHDLVIPIINDNIAEPCESFICILQGGDLDAVRASEPNQVTIRISDDDLQVKFSQSSVATTEEEGRVLVTVEAMGDLSSDFSIIVMAISGSAVEPFDFTGNVWPVDFLANQASASFEISIVQDNLPETPEEFFLKIVIESPYDERVTVGEPSRLTVVITVRNDTVRGTPLFSIPLPSKYTAHTELESIRLCFEIHGQARKHYNLISDACTSVSAQYKQGENDAELNVISNIGVKAQGSNGSCHEIEVDLVGCSAQLDGTTLNTSVTVNGISIMIRRQRVRVSVPNCASSTRLTMWMICTTQNNEDMLELVVARGDRLEPTAHGLIGQFWNIPMNITSYTGPYGDGIAVASDRIYSVTVAYPGAPERTFIADYVVYCLYAGGHNGGPIGEVPGSGSVIEGKYSDYEVAGLFATDYGFSRFEANC